MNKIIHCPTKEDWKRVVQKLLDDGCNWSGGEGTNLNFWTSYEEKSCVSVEERTLEFSPKSYYQKNYPNIPIITADEFMGGEEREFKVGDKVEILGESNQGKIGIIGIVNRTTCYPYGVNFPLEDSEILNVVGDSEDWANGNSDIYENKEQLKLIDEGKEESYIMPNVFPNISSYVPTPSFDYMRYIHGVWDEPPTESKIKTMLKKIPRTLKRVLSPDLQKQYKAGLINGDLELTEKGREEMFDILSQEDAVKKGLTKFAEEIIEKAKKKD